MRVWIVSEPTWEGEFDSAWSTETLALARADALDPYPDKHGVRWGIVSVVTLDEPESEEPVPRGRS